MGVTKKPLEKEELQAFVALTVNEIIPQCQGPKTAPQVAAIKRSIGNKTMDWARQNGLVSKKDPK